MWAFMTREQVICFDIVYELSKVPFLLGVCMEVFSMSTARA